MINKNIPDKGFTHAGTFHADDVFSTALLKILNPDFKVERGFAVPENFDGIIYDIGLGEFDHHQEGNEKRKNGVEYASFGKLWKEYGHFILPDNECNHFDHNFIEHLDLSDNTGEKDNLASVISSFNPFWDEPENSDKYFNDAVDYAISILNKQFARYNKNREAEVHVLEAYRKSNKKVVILDRYYPWVKALSTTTAKYVIHPSQRGGYSIQCIPSKNGKLKVEFPNNLRGKNENELSEVIEGLRFVHNSGFCATANTIDACMKLVEYTENNSYMRVKLFGNEFSFDGNDIIAMDHNNKKGNNKHK